MTVSLKIYDLSVPEDLRNLTLELSDGSTVENLAYECVGIDGLPYTYENIIGSAILVNSSLAAPATTLNDGDKVIIMRPMEGG